jgi:hypothetical protein
MPMHSRIYSLKKIMIQFHATSEELVEYLNSVSNELDLIMTVMPLRPFSLKRIDDLLSLQNIDVNSDIRVILTKDELHVGATSPNNFYDLNPGTIGLDIGRLTERGLEESALTFMSDDADKIAIANKVASKLKKITKAGVVAINPNTGKQAKVRTHRYTADAKKLYDEGVKIVPLGGFILFKLIE